MNFAAHELLETSEALRVKAAEIEQHGMYANQCKDQQLKSILRKHQMQMMSSYQQGINLLQGKGGTIAHQHPSFANSYTMEVGIENQTKMAAPSMTTQALTDQTIATLALNTHKSGAVMGMMWANECTDPQIRMYHVNGANLCQEMAYEIFSWMNQNGYYQPPAFSGAQVSQMTAMFQPMTTNMMGNQMTGSQMTGAHNLTNQTGFNNHMQ